VLTIRKEQMDVFVADLLAQYKERLLRELSSAFPEHAARLGEEGMQAFIDRGIDTARQHRITTERDVADFITLILKTTADIDATVEKNAIRNILEDQTLTGPFKLQLIHLQLTGRLLER
jgi:hypothetical protein